MNNNRQLEQLQHLSKNLKESTKGISSLLNEMLETKFKDMGEDSAKEYHKALSDPKVQDAVRKSIETINQINKK